MIDIKDTSNNIRFSTEINTGSKRKFTLVQEDYITLRFSVADPVYFKLGDHIDTELGLFELVDLYKPTLNESTGGYDYELRLDAYYWKWKNKIFKFAPEVGGNEASWKLTSTLDVHLGVFLRNLSALGYKYKGQNFEFKIDNTVSSSSKLIVYENTNLIDALTQMAETWECEWWMEDNQICFGRCEFGDPVDFEIGNNVERMERSESKATFATRVYAFGSTRNLPINYRPVDENIVVGGIVHKRLMLPVGVPFVDAYQDMTTEEAVEDVVVFDDIYPRRTGTMSSVTPVEKTENIENIDGTTTQEKFNVYQFKDTGITFSKDYILAGEELRIVFQSGALSGMDFGVIFNPNNKPEKLEDGSWNPDAQLWEIVRNEDYGRMLPGDSLVPKNGDTYNLYGFDSTSAVFGSMVLNAEKELEQAAKDYVEKTKIDPNTYSCTMMSDYMYNEGDDRTNEFTVGAKIKLINPAYFETGRVSRVIGYEFDLDIPYSSPIFTIGETASYSRISDLEQKVEELTYKGQIYTGTGAGVYIIGTNDNTSPTNKNVYSALKVLREFVRYQGWVNQPLRTFDPVQFNSITSTEFESKVKGWLIDALGNAEFRDLLIRSFKSWNFAAGPLGAGVGMVNDDELQTDKLLVRKTMYVLEMMIQRMRFQGGIIVLSPATGFKIDSVEVFDTYYRVHCRPEDLNEFEVNDQARIQNFTGNNIKYLWSLVLAKGSDYVDISRVDKDGDGVPSVGDEIVQLGNRTNPERQDAVLLSAVNGEVGLFTYFGINSFDLSGKEGSWFGKHGGKKGAVIRGEVHITAGSDGLDQFTEYEDVDKRIQDTKDLADSVQYVVNDLTSVIIPDLQGQIDGSIMSHEGTVPPTLTNEPAVKWTSEEEKNRHIGDYYDYFLTVDGQNVTERYKFSKLNGEYQWVRVADSGSALAASVAREALGLAGTKATITWGDTLPTVPYNINDVWIKTNGSMYICNHQRLEGETGSQSDWQLFNDTMLRLAKMADDNVITKEEKATLRDTWNQIQKEFTAYQAQATKYGVSITALQNAYNTLNTFLTNTVKIAQDIDSNLSVAQKTEYNQDFANYYSERTAFANVIAQKVADESVGNLQIGMVNLLKGSNVELGAQKYDIGRYYFDKKPEVGKTYTLVVCYTIGVNNTHIGAYQDYGFNLISNFTTKGNKVVETRTFKYSSTRSEEFMNFYQFPNGTYGSKVHWAVLVEGNKGPNAWIPSLSEQGETAAKNEVNNLQIGSVNLVSRKMMLAWNEKNKDIAVWGQDSDGIYLNVSPGRLFDIISTSSYNPIFTLTFKPNTQYVFSVEWKHANQSATGNGLVFYIIYTDGTRDSVILSSDMKIMTRVDLISARDKTIFRISSGFGNWNFNALVYSLALYEGNKVLAEPPVATEDLTGQSNVNLLDNSKFQFGTKGYEPNNQSTLNIVNEILQSRSSQTSGTPGVRLPIVHLNQGVYSFKVIVKGINIPSCYIAVYKGDMSGFIASTREYVSILPTFTEKSLTFANSEEGDYRIIILWNASTATAYPAGLDIEYSILVEGFTPPSSYSPSPGDVAKDIKDVSDAVSNLDTTINTTFKDGIISEAEAKAIASNINVLNAEKADVDAYYNKLHANAYLAGTAKTNLASAKTAYNTAHTNLINSINTAIADGKATATEKADVDAKFSAYNNALSAYQTRVGEADKAIQDTIKKVADDAQTSANTAQSAANAAQSTANQAQADANAANSKLTTWASDNYISPQEKTALRQQKSDIQSEKKDIESNANMYVISLASYMAAYNAAISALNKYTATSPENIAVSSDYNNIAAYYPARQTILNSIAAAAKAQADKATGAIGMDGGKMLYADPEFKLGLNGSMTYSAQNGGGTVLRYRVSKSTGQDVSNSFTPAVAAHVKENATGSPYNGSDWCMYIRAYGGTSSSHLGGFNFGTPSRANAVFIVKVSAKIPVGYTLKNVHNSHGTGYKQEFLTPMVGTGKYETYIFKETCGSTGTFSTMNYLFLSGPVKPGNDPLDPDNAPLEWFVDYATVFDLTADGYGDIEYNAKDDLAQQLGYSNFDKMVENASKGETIINGAYINTQLIDVETLVADTALVDKLTTRILTTDSITANMISVGGFEFQNGQIFGGKDFGLGPGVKITSIEGDLSFKAYKDTSNYISMFYNSASDWGLKGVVGGVELLKLGITNKIGPFTIEGQWLRGSNLALSGSQLSYSYNGHSVHVGSHPDMSTGGNTKLGTFMLSGGSYGGLESYKQVALIVGAPSNNNSYALALTSGLALIKGQVIFNNPTVSANIVVEVGFNSGHFVMLSPVSGNPVVSVNAGLPVGSWFLIGQATAAGGYYYIKLSGSERFNRLGNAYQQINSHNQDPTLIFKVSSTVWLIGNLPVNWIDWN
jgi:hypothetical protein